MTTTTINAKALNEIATKVIKSRAENRLARLEDFIVTRVLPECQKKAEDGQFNHREEFVGHNYNEVTTMIEILSTKYGFDVRRLEGGRVLIKWNEEEK